MNINILVSIIVDVILLAIVVAGLVIGIKKGFIKIIAKPVKFVLALYLAFTLASPFSTAFVEPMIEAPVTNQMRDFISEKCGDISHDNIDDELPTVLKITASVFDIDLDSFPEDATSEDIIGEIVTKLISPAIHLISTVLTFVLLYFVLNILLSLLILLINSILNKGAVGVANKILGGTISFAFSLIVAWALASVFTYVISFPAFASVAWLESFEGGFIYKFFNKLNPIDIILGF